MSARQPIGKKVRFEVFKRDLFTCQYCGRTPPAVVLECDHIQPVAEGGSSSTDNLLTACFDCNRGKGAAPLTASPETVATKAAILAEREEQIAAFNELQAEVRRRQDRDIDAVDEVYQSYFPEWQLARKFREDIRVSFLGKLPLNEIVDAMQLACSRKAHNGDQAIKYFCGICWRKIRGD